METLEKYRKYDKFWIGIIMGFIIPVILYFIIQPLKGYSSILSMPEKTAVLMQLLPKLMTKVLIPSGLFFFLFYYIRFDKIAKGILLSLAILVGILFILQVAF